MLSHRNSSVLFRKCLLEELRAVMHLENKSLTVLLWNKSMAPCLGGSGIKFNKLPITIIRSNCINLKSQHTECLYWTIALRNCFLIIVLQDSQGNVHQVWYDDPESISLKAAYVRQQSLRGIGMWNGNLLDYSDDPVAQKQSAEMWNALINKSTYI